MKKLVLYLFAFSIWMGCTPKYSSSQTSNDAFKQKYADKLEPGSKLLKAGYHYTLEQTANGTFVAKTFFPETRQMTHFYTFSDQTTRTPHGKAMEWWDDGQAIFEGQFVKGKREGEWTFYQDSVASTGMYKNGKREGLWIGKDLSGTRRSEFNYLDDESHGPFKVWNREGKLHREGSFTHGEIEWEKNYDENSKGEVFKIVQEQPRFPGCDDLTDEKERKKCSDEKMLQMIYSNIKYPAKARELDVEGTAILSFVVNKDGSISDVITRRGLCKDIQTECERIIHLMPDWLPGRQDGEPVRVKFNLPVKFKLE